MIGRVKRQVVRLARITVEDTADLAAVFAQVAGRHVRDTFVASRSRFAHRARRRARS